MTRVVIAGGGVAALEAALVLRDLAGDRVDLTLVAPDELFVYRPLSVGAPFALGQPRRLPLEALARDVEADLHKDALASVDAEGHRVHLAGGGELAYDMLLVAIGARRVPAYEHATTFRGQEDSEAVHGLIQDLEGGYVKRIAFVVPPGVAWPLPLYELALMAAERASDLSLNGVELTVVTPEEEPLGVFGHEASAAVRGTLEAAGVRFESSAWAEVPNSRTVILRPGTRVLECDRVVALPDVEPLPIVGLDPDADGFLPVDAHGCVIGLQDVYAAGDGTRFPVKQGGIACQQADAAAESIALGAGAAITPRPFHPVLRGELLTGARPLYLRSDISGTGGDSSEGSGHTLWWPPAKIAGEYLAPYLETRAATPVETKVALPGVRRGAAPTHPAGGGHGIDLLGFEYVG